MAIPARDTLPIASANSKELREAATATEAAVKATPAVATPLAKPPTTLLAPPAALPRPLNVALAYL